jgi:L-threonylcarbamoyladenylate synthase
LVNIAACSADFTQVGKKILAGDVVVFPTDTIYGLGTSPFSVEGIRRCFEIKNRQMEKKLPVLFSSAEEAEKLVVFDERAKLISEGFWPGQVTLVLPAKSANLPEEILGKDRTLAVRVPNHECCVRLIASCGNSLIGTSANISGNPPFVDPDDPELLEFVVKVDHFIKGRCGNNRLPSTILDLSKKDRISVIRDGAVSSHKIANYLFNVSKTDFSFNATRS